MFERFSKEARAAVVDAQDVARECGSPTVDSRHLLVAVLGSSPTVRLAMQTSGSDPTAVVGHLRSELRNDRLDEAALASLGVDLDAVRRRAEESFGPDALDPPRGRRGHLPFAKDARKTIELSLREAIRLEQRTIRSAHLLLGLLHADNPGRNALIRADVDTQALRTALDQEARAA
jgi:ATP-dependent Clp protease ATP-binding subunit ClpA